MAKKPWHEPEGGESFILAPQCRIRCCDCGLVHEFDIKLLVSIKRDNRSTGQVRRWKKITNR